jgi:para-aminobenzoate synthetase component 1
MPGKSKAISSYFIENKAGIKQKMLNWAERFSIFCFLDNQQYTIQPHNYECLLAAGNMPASMDDQQFQLVDQQINKGEWLFGHISYEAGFPFFNINSSKQDKIGFPNYYFFKPEIVCMLRDDHIWIEAPEPDLIYEQIISETEEFDIAPPLFEIKQRLSKEKYIEKVKSLQQHILRGDCYEVNFCQHFYCEDVICNPQLLFQKLSQFSPNPFSAFYKLDDKYLICASPERFLCKKGNTIFSQPMKGTSKRDADDMLGDKKRKDDLFKSEKDRSENVMVVDMVRNDLSKICLEGSVRVEELFGIYSYPYVHQMISTVVGELKQDVSFSDIIKATFPMGSMTGAPKQRVMELINDYEENSRGIFSGTVGYINSEGDFDFNVVIRSIMYNTSTSYLEYAVGSGITFYSDPGQEWEECLLKAEAIKKVLTS